MRIKHHIKRGLSLFLTLVLLLGLIPMQAVKVNALTPTYTVSSAYRNSSYYTNLCNVQLTGNQRDDIINVALSQVGYAEGSYSGDTGGADDGSYDNYTEYNYWYNKYISSGMPIGGSYAPWCATFVSWCAEQAQIPTSVLQRSTAAGHSAWYFNVKFYAGGSTLNSSSDNTDLFMGYNYTPKKGDLFFTRSWSHVGLVVGVSGSYVITVEGNTNDGGSAEGLGVFRRTSRRIADLYFGVPDYQEDYASSCTYYPAHCRVKVDSTTPINTQPCSVSTAYNSENLGDAYAGQIYTATGLYLNGYGNYWYRVETAYGKTAYLYAGDTTYMEDLISDIAISGAEAPSAHVAGEKFSVSGTIKAQYNRIDTAACYIYSGFGTGGSVVTGYRDSVNGTQYSLIGSNVDYNTSFGDLGTGKHTYELSATYTNYYATSNTTIASNSGKVSLLTHYFVVIPESVDQSTCAHAYTTTTVGAANCLEGGTQVKACSVCGLVSTTGIAAGSHSYGAWTTVSNASCTADGEKKRTCAACGDVETQTVKALGHQYSTVIEPATCTEYAVYKFTCGSCGDAFSRSEKELTSEWLDFLPGGMEDRQFESMTQYRYSDYETVTSAEASLAGYTQTGSSWVQTGTGRIEYVPSWPSGFAADSALYEAYHNVSSKKLPMETETSKTVIDSDEPAGYLYYHWCYADSYYCVANKDSSYNIFHAYYDTTDPDSYTCDTSDMSYKTSHSTCSNSNWWFVTQVYQQSYTDYQKMYTYERWTDYTDWSSTPVTSDTTRKVETRTVYRLKNAAAPAGHKYAEGFCSVCNAADPNYQNPTEPSTVDYYLIGYINGADYGCESDYQNMGQYKFVSGKLTVTFDEDSYVFLKTTDNGAWYMTETYVTGTSANYYNTLTGASEKMLVPGGKEITFTLVENGDGSLTLSYVAREETVTPTGTVEPKSATLSLEDEVLINLYFIVEEMDVTSENVGMLIYNEKPETANVATADTVIEGGVYNEANGRYMVSTPGIPGQYLADSLYLVAYAKDANGHYVYARTVEYSGKKYCTSQMTKGTAELKATCVALMNYGAAAQQYFAATTDYTYETLMNEEFAQYQDLVVDYSEDLLAVRGTVDSAKAGTLGTTVNGFTKRSVSMSADGDFSLNYYLTTDKAVDKVTFYYWTAEQYASVSKLTLQNASGSKEMVLTDGTNRYWANVSGIAAKDIDQTVYACGVYEVDGVTYSSGVFSYSIGYYCTSKAAGTDETVKPFAKAIAVYSYHARIFLESMN